MSGQRTIVHLDLDSFFVSVERVHNKGLVGKPVLWIATALLPS